LQSTKNNDLRRLQPTITRMFSLVSRNAEYLTPHKGE